ncbi:MAG: DUF1700 domain-containing protein [Actinomycetota bacterium]
MNATLHPAADRYLKELDRALAGLPDARRREIVGEIQSHIEEAVPPGATDADVRNALGDLGDPDFIAADAFERFGITRPKAGALEGFAIALLLVGGVLLPILGWIIGVVLLWVSRAWTLRDKLIGTLVVPGGLALAFYFGLFATGGSSSCTTQVEETGGIGTPVTICSGETVGPGFLWTMLLVVLIVAPIATAVYLGRRGWGGRRPSAQ